jgi:hypothetical protein
MGVLTWVLGEGQAVPKNYNALELNEARINWFNPSPTYNAVVIAAADEAGGQGFVTEFAQPTTALREVVWSTFEESDWQSLRTSSLPPDQIYSQAAARYSSFDGFWEVVQAHATLPTGIALETLQSCPTCYPVTELDAQGFLGGLEEQVIEPVRLVQRIIDEQPDVTRLYTTLSAAEMTVDPLFTFNPDLPNVSNIHQAERVIECRGGYYEFQAPWRIELPGGGVVRGGPNDVGNWPTAFDAQPANQRIMRQGESGPGLVLEDNTSVIEASLAEHNASVPAPPRRDSGGCSLSAGRANSALGFGLLGTLWLLGRRGQRRSGSRGH